MSEPSKEIPFKIRVGVALFKDDKILLVRQNNHPFWVLPGGTLEPDEDLAECAIRELMEETGISITVGPLLYVTNFIQPHRHSLDVFFLTHFVSGEWPPHTAIPENINEMGFFSLAETQKMPLQPSHIAQRLLADWADGFKGQGGIYLGKTERVEVLPSA